MKPDVFDGDPDIGIRFPTTPLGGCNTFLLLPLHILSNEKALGEETRGKAQEMYEILLRAHKRNKDFNWGKWTFLIH